MNKRITCNEYITLLCYFNQLFLSNVERKTPKQILDLANISAVMKESVMSYDIKIRAVPLKCTI